MDSRRDPFLLAQAADEGGRIGWRYKWVDLAESELAGSNDLEPWQPEFLSTEQFVVITRLCEGHRVLLDNELLDYLGERGVDLEELKKGLLETGLVAMAGHEIELITNRCQTAMLPDSRLIAGEDSAGRLTRWIARCLENR